MAAASTHETFPCTREQFFNLITDFEKYPEFLSEVKSCKVLETKGGKKLVEFHVNVIKTFSYRMWMTEDAPQRLSWTLDSGDLFKTSTGFWELKDAGPNTDATYSVEATFKIFVPGPVAKALVNVNLPNMMRAYKERVKKIYG
jgi:ribosome-associated toxin RatA of RatAB toxin-antitoxin module